MVGFFIILIFLVLGIFTGINIILPAALYKYIIVMIFVIINSIFKYINLKLNKKLSIVESLLELIINIFVALFFSSLGEFCNLDIYIAVIAVFIFNIFKELSKLVKQLLLMLRKYKND